MRPEEIERFFAARVVGTDALAMAVHESGTGRLVGTCAFSQLDGDNGSALYHITIGEADVWGHGYGTEATRLMMDHAFGTLGLHRVGLFVFEFNERAIRAYQRCRVRPRGPGARVDLARGRWWDELAMSVLESDWRRIRRGDAEAAGDPLDAEPSRRRVERATSARPRRPRRTGCASDRAMAMTPGPAADAARADVRELIAAKGHTVDNARAAVARLDAAFAAGDLERTPSLDQFLADLCRPSSRTRTRSWAARAPRPPSSSCAPSTANSTTPDDRRRLTLG